MAKKISKEFKTVATSVNKVALRETTKEPAANSLTKQRIEKLFRMFCSRRADYDGTGPKFFNGGKCSECILHEIPWKRKSGHIRDLCYAIWQEGFLNG